MTTKLQREIYTARPESLDVRESLQAFLISQGYQETVNEGDGPYLQRDGSKIYLAQEVWMGYVYDPQAQAFSVDTYIQGMDVYGPGRFERGEEIEEWVSRTYSTPIPFSPSEEVVEIPLPILRALGWEKVCDEAEWRFAYRSDLPALFAEFAEDLDRLISSLNAERVEMAEVCGVSL